MANARDPPKPKIGSGSFAAWIRTGLRELRAALYPESNIAQQYGDPGIWGNKTPGEIAEARRFDARDMDEERGSILDRYVKQAEASRDVGRERDGKDITKE